MYLNNLYILIVPVHKYSSRCIVYSCMNQFISVFFSMFLDDHSNIPVGVAESSNWCGYSTSSYSPSVPPHGGTYAAYPDAIGSTGPAMDAPSASEFFRYSTHFDCMKKGVHSLIPLSTRSYLSAVRYGFSLSDHKHINSSSF